MINKRKLLVYASLATMMISLNGCKKQEQTYSDNITTEITTEENTREYVREKYYNFDCFESAKEEIKKYINEKNYELAKEKGKEYFITAVDFIFYGTEINGVTFNDLNEENKKQTYENLCTIDEWIMEIDPNYKESFSEKYNKVKEFTVDKYNDVKDYLKEQIGDENVEKINETKENVQEELKEQGENAKKKIKTWYEDFRK